MHQVKFLPWEGLHYSKGFNGVRTLVLGESHYQWNRGRDIKEWREVTRTLVQEQLDGGYTKAFWTNIAFTFLNRAPSLDDKRAFWSSVAFYNYVQESAGGAARLAPKDESWQASEGAFSTVLHQLKPEFILVLGYRLWKRLPPMNRTEAADGYGWAYRYDGGSAVVYGIRHPSSGFNARKWHDRVVTALKKANSKSSTLPR